MGSVNSCRKNGNSKNRSRKTDSANPSLCAKTNKVASCENGNGVTQNTRSLQEKPSLSSLSSTKSRTSVDSSGDDSRSGLRRSRGSKNLLTVDKVFDEPTSPTDRNIMSASVNGVNPAISTPHIPRPPTKESNQVNLSQTGDATCLNQYKLFEEIGKGSYGVVRLCYSEFNQTSYAMKIMSKKRLIRKAGLMRPCDRGKKDGLENLRREIAILKKVDHPNIVKLHEVLDDPSDDNLYLVFELVEKGPVMEVPTDNPLCETDARKYFRDIHSGIEYLHFNRIVHRDIKPSNLLLGDDGHIKIADFGVADIFDDEDALLTKAVGSPAFMAPETLQANKNKYSGKGTDVWAMGITLYCFIFGKVPFDETNRFALYEQIRTGSFDFPDEISLSPTLEDLLLRMLIKDPNERITIAEMKVHPWLTKGGSDPLPSTYENSTVLEPTEEEIINSIRCVPKIKTLILVKHMLKHKHFASREKLDRLRFSTGSIS